jgi:ubiquinone/menaquinone biosynthesis C-methylase UbiE
MKVRWLLDLYSHCCVNMQLFVYCSFVAASYNMDLKTAISLVRSPKLKSNTPTNWADLGCGSGLFTNALSTLLQTGSKIIAVDKDASALKKVNVVNGIILERLHTDFINDDLPLRNINGIVMANALHFIKDKKVFLQMLQPCLNEAAHFLIVEYDTAQSNPWVPYPLHIEGWQKLFRETGYSQNEEINRHPSVYRKADIVGMWFSK